MFIEALSNKPLEEANWVRELIKTHETLVGDIPHRIVAYADLTQESKVVEELLAAYVCLLFVRGGNLVGLVSWSNSRLILTVISTQSRLLHRLRRSVSPLGFDRTDLVSGEESSGSGHQTNIESSS